MKIKYKFTVGLSLILITLGMLLNILIRQTLASNMERNVNDYLKEIMNSTREYIKYRLIINASALNGDGLNEESTYIIKYISLNYHCDSQIRDMKGKVLQNIGNIGFEEIINKGNIIATEGKAVVNLKYINNGVQGILSYPLYVDGQYLGIITINKNYNELYFSYKNIVGLITMIELIVFFVIFILGFLMTSKITKPIMVLTKAVKQVGDGSYDIKIEVKGKDEVSMLSKEFINMTDKIKQQIQTIELEKEKVERLEKSRKEFFNNVTHEIKTPLTAISGYAEMLLQEIVKDEEFNKRAIERIYSESERLNRLVIDMIEVSKGLSFIDEERKQLDMYKILNEICDDMSIKARKYSLEIIRNIKIGSVLGQANKIRELIINIIDNAIKYSINGEQIIVRSENEGNYYKFEVLNKAELIPDEVYNNIFDPFIKSKNPEEKQSRGLGLYICNEIVKEHYGEINIENGKVIIIKIKIPSFGNNLETNQCNLVNSL